MSRSALKAIIFDHGVLLKDFADPQVADELRKLLPWLKAIGLDLVVFSSNPQEMQRRLKAKGLPEADLFLTETDVGARKGSDKWVEAAARCLGIRNHQFVYVGDDDRDWKSAINAASCYLQANWAGALPERLSALSVDRPRDVVKYLTHYLLPPPRWTYSLDLEDENVYVRSLLPAHVDLPSTAPSSSFTLQNIFGHNSRDVTVGEESARNILMLHALSSLYLEGLIKKRSLFAVYPSHMPGKISEQLQGYLAPAASFFGAYFRPDLLVRWTEAPDTSRERGIAWREDRPANVSFSDQVNTVHVNPARRQVLNSDDRNVVIFDDFTTTGMSLEWARNLLYSAGANRVVIMTIGKYGRTPRGKSHHVHLLRSGAAIHPYEPTEYNVDSLVDTRFEPMQDNELSESIIRTSFEHLKEHVYYPINTL